jgi:hypothetical protein
MTDLLIINFRLRFGEVLEGRIQGRTLINGITTGPAIRIGDGRLFCRRLSWFFRRRPGSPMLTTDRVLPSGFRLQQQSAKKL